MKKVIAVVLAVFTCLFLSGCAPVYTIIDVFYGNDVIEKAQSVPHVAFSNGELFKDSQEIHFTADDFSEVKSEYAAYRSDLYFNALSPEEQTVYLAFEYALENSYSNVLIDYALVDEAEALEKILEYFALDSPLLEQNLRFNLGTFDSSYPVEILGLYESYANFDGVYITVDNFSSELWEKRMEALEAAKKWVAELPQSLSDFEKAEKLYLNLAKSVEYITYNNDDDTVYPYLYDALVTGKTHCDGHANALSLLLRLAGIDACEKNYTSADPDEAGHTWVTFNIDGKWYNADSTSDSLIPLKDCSMKSGYYFAFSDDMRPYTEDYDDVTPVCAESKYMNPDAFINDLSDNSFSQSVISAYDKRTPDWAFIIVYRNNESSLDRQLQRVADQTYSSVYWLTIDLANGGTAVIVYSKGLF